MNAVVKNRASTIAGVSLFALVGFIAANGEKFFAVATAGWNWVLVVWDKMPASWVSYLAAWGLGLAVMFALRRWVPDPGQGNKHNNLRVAAIELAASAATFTVVALQVPDIRGGLIPLIFGLICALTTPLSYRIVAAVGELIRDSMRRGRADLPATPVHNEGGDP